MHITVPCNGDHIALTQADQATKVKLVTRLAAYLIGSAVLINRPSLSLTADRGLND